MNCTAIIAMVAGMLKAKKVLDIAPRMGHNGSTVNEQREHTMSYMIEQTHDDGEKSYLNHAYMSTLSFGSPDMAWMTEDREKADLMLFKVLTKNSANTKIFEVVEW